MPFSGQKKGGFSNRLPQTVKLKQGKPCDSFKLSSFWLVVLLGVNSF